MPPASREDAVLAALRAFARDVKSKAALGGRFQAGPEDHLKTSVSNLVGAVARHLGMQVEVIPEARVDDVSGRPDLAVTVDGLLVGYIELKAPGIGTTDRELRGRNRDQFNRFRKLPNLIYTDANHWTFYRKGEEDDVNQRRRRLDVRLGELPSSGDDDLTEDDAQQVQSMLQEFLNWSPIVPGNAKALANQLAPLTRMLRDDVEEAVGDPERPALAAIYADWKRTLFPEASPAEFADSYAQTFTYGLLLAKLSGSTVLDTHDAALAIAHHSSLLSQTLLILTQPGTRKELGVGVDLLERTIDAVDPDVLSSTGDPWLYFYEDFLAVYDRRLRNERGVYYTPAQVVKAQVTLVDELLRRRFGKLYGVADSDVTVLDPATGTGTYLLRVLQHGVEHVIAQRGPGAAVASQMANNLYGFELLVGPYAVAHLRLTQQVKELGGHEPTDGVHIYLADTLESPIEEQPALHSYFERPLAEEHRRAREVKRETQILVCIGNPPYDREESDSGEENPSGRWVRFGSTPSLLDTFLLPARRAGAGVHIKNLYNQYVYFWRWALWKVFETQDGPGIVSFITASSYLRGPGFVGMREEMRRTFDELWIVDLEGDSRGTRTTENVFDIRTPVAIAIGLRLGQPDRDTPAATQYTRLTGTRQEKFSALNELSSVSDLKWEAVGEGWGQPLVGLSAGDYFAWPALTDLLPWQHSGAQLKRLWPIAEERSLLEQRWRMFMASADRPNLFRETRDRHVRQTYPDQLSDQGALPTIASLSAGAPPPAIVRYGYRSLDRQYILRDTRLGDFWRPALWKSLSERQLFTTSMLGGALGFGPAISITAHVPDLHHFRGSFGGKDVMPLYRDATATEPNITRGLLDLLGSTYDLPVSPEDLIGYLTGALGHPGYTERFRDELEVPGPRVPLTKDPALFRRAVELGQQVIAWQTYAERFPEVIGTTQGRVPAGNARVVTAIPEDPEKYPRNVRNDVRYDDGERELHVGEGVLSDVAPEVWAYEVSGLQIVRSWLGYRMKERSGRSSSPLDEIRPERWTFEMTRELQDLVWALEGVIALQPTQAELLAEIVAGDLFLASELPTPTNAEREAPSVERRQQLGLGLTL